MDKKIIIIDRENFDSFEETAINILSKWKSERNNSIKPKINYKFRKTRLFTPSQLIILNEFYKNNKYISIDKSIQLSRIFGVTRKQINTWFQNKRSYGKQQK